MNTSSTERTGRTNGVLPIAPLNPATPTALVANPLAKSWLRANENMIAGVENEKRTAHRLTSRLPYFYS